MKIVIFEDADYRFLYPLTYLRPVFELRCGAFSLYQKVRKKFPDCEVHLETRDVLAEIAGDTYGSAAANSDERLQPDDDMLLVNAGAILTSPAASYCARESVATNQNGDFIWAYLKGQTVKEFSAGSARELAVTAKGRFEPQTTEDILIKYPWDLVNWNAQQIVSDFAAAYGPRLDAKLDPLVGVRGELENLHVAEGAEVQPHTFIDCRGGPVIIGPGAVVHAHSSIHGPAFIGQDSQLFEARIREATSIGPVCRVGGEVEGCIIHGHSNKYHTGFLGHSYVCEWVNLGALTANSDLKNDYTSITVYLNGKPMETGMLKVGSFIGDHTKTSIGTLLNTGSVVGIMCNLVGGTNLLPKYLPSFCWYLEGKISKGLGLAQSLHTARAAMARRRVELTDAMVKLIKHTEELTRPEKLEKVRRDRRKAFRRNPRTRG